MPEAPTSLLDTDRFDAAGTGEASFAAERALVDRIVNSRHLAKSQLLSTFFLYICSRALEDPDVRITELELGITVFERGPDFDPREDNIVRNYVRQLRKRLESFYTLEGIDETITIDIPRGGYVPTFTRRSLPPQETTEPVEVKIGSTNSPKETSPTPTTAPGPLRIRFVFPMVVGVIALLTLLWDMGLPFSHTAIAGHFFATRNPFWSQIFSEDRNTIVVPSDTAFVIVQQANHRTFTLSEYLRWFSTRPTTDEHLEMAYLRGETYTSMPSLEIVAMLQKLPEVIQSRFMIRAPRALRFEDLREDNVILLGSSYSNPWCELFEKQLNFRVINHPELNRYWIVDQHPSLGGQQLYESKYSKNSLVTYASIAMLPNLSGKGHVLIIQGLDAAATWGTADFLLHRFNPNEVSGNFELLLEIISLDASSTTTSARILMSRNISK